MYNATNLFSSARTKLQVSIGGRDQCSLHRWVLLKNSIINSPVATTHPTTSDPSSLTPVYHAEDDSEEEVITEDADSFMFPDAGKLVGPTIDTNASESHWLDSLLETLGDEDEDEFTVESEAQSSILLPADDEDEDPLLFSPMASPMSSSDDLPNQPAYYPHSIDVSYSYPYPIPYPALHPPLMLHTSLPSHYEDPLPYHDFTDSETLSVPDAIEDTSDDESDVLPTPLGLSASSLDLVEAASIPLPADPSHLRHAYPAIRVDAEDSYFYPFELDPLPFPLLEDSPSYNTYQEC